MRKAIALVLIAGLIVAADKPKVKVPKNLAPFQGSWTILSAEKDGKPDDALKNAKLVFEGDHFTRTKAKETAKGTVKVNPSTKPAQLDSQFTEGQLKGKTVLGIYTLEGDTMKICVGLADKARPKDFNAKAGSGQMLVVLKKDKAKVAAKPAPKPATPPPPKTPPAPSFSFPDKNLEAAVRAVLHEPSASLTEEKLNNVYILEATGKNIANLAGLEKCKNLQLLQLTKNQVADLKPLKDLVNLQSLDVKSNRVVDISPLAGLTKLQYLELSGNQVAQLAPLSKLTSLQSLYLSGNKIANIAPLENLKKLSSLALGQNQIKDIGPLTGVNRLLTLDLDDNQIDNLTAITKQTELTMLLVRNNKISDLAPLIPWAKADAEGAKRFAPYLEFYVKGNPLSEAAKTTQTMELQKLGVRFK